jgi:transposase
MSRTERADYPTDLSDEPWQILHPPLPKPSRRDAAQTVCRCAILNAIFYLLRSGCAWRMLPHDVPKWSTVYGVFLHCRKNGTWQNSHDALREKVRAQAGRKLLPSAAVLDIQTVRTTEVGASELASRGNCLGGTGNQFKGHSNLGFGELSLRDKPALSYHPREGREIAKASLTPLSSDLLIVVNAGVNLEQPLLFGMNDKNDVPNAPGATVLIPQEADDNSLYIRGIQLLASL